MVSMCEEYVYFIYQKDHGVFLLMQKYSSNGKTGGRNMQKKKIIQKKREI